ncbi:hypothetical protein NM688_g8667 [Phlebia brevispora]|uniref:Uncharacterized protein n=1 Tax=Phlebia brevispora TaxID=194682 RepID=A0ACC1RP34_9APHY|nr:hypothetical protein NM688_g8667 [Phlebia brevispora]
MGIYLPPARDPPVAVASFGMLRGRNRTKVDAHFHTLWFMQAHLKDLAVSHYGSESFLICQRVLNQCHEMIYADLPASGAPYATLNMPTLPGYIRKKIKPHVQPALVGMGLMLSGTPGIPALVDLMGEVVIEQGRLDDRGEDLRSLENLDGVVRPQVEHPSDSLDEEKDDADADDSDSEEQLQQPPLPRRAETAFEGRAPLTAARLRSGRRKGDAPSRRQTIAAQTSPALPLHLRDPRKPRLSDDPFSQRDPPLPAQTASPFQSTPTFSPWRHPRRPGSLNLAETLLHKYEPAAQQYLLRTHFCRSEIQFILALENICNRLLVVPKPARVSALRAELTALNHLLPAEVCMPMWCSSRDEVDPNSKVPEPHHRIVRIPPGESVVLNSAERAPYLLLIEVIHGDLDFDPTKRNNKEILKKIVVKENERKGASKDLIAFNGAPTQPPPVPSRQPSMSTMRERPEVEIGLDTSNLSDDSPDVSASSVVPITPVDTPVDEEEEIDLVEQVYGPEDNLLSRSIDLSETIILPPPPKNKELDM